jgi:hypothetical protein
MENTDASNDDPIVLFKLKDYTTQIVGRWSVKLGCLYVQRGDGTCYRYGGFGVEHFQILSQGDALIGYDAQHYIDAICAGKYGKKTYPLFPVSEFDTLTKERLIIEESKST